MDFVGSFAFSDSHNLPHVLRTTVRLQNLGVEGDEESGNYQGLARVAWGSGSSRRKCRRRAQSFLCLLCDVGGCLVTNMLPLGSLVIPSFFNGSV